MAFVNMNREKDQTMENVSEPREKTFKMSPSLTSCRALCGRDNPCGNSHCSNYRGFKRQRREKQ